MLVEEDDFLILFLILDQKQGALVFEVGPHIAINIVLGQDCKGDSEEYFLKVHHLFLNHSEVYFFYHLPIHSLSKF